MSLQTSNYNLLTQPRWVAVLPIQAIDTDYSTSNIAFNLYNFNLAPASIASNDVGYQGYAVPMPVAVKDTKKTFTFHYMPDSALSQYQFLYKWMSKLVVEAGSGIDPNITRLSDLFVTVRVLLLSEFKNFTTEIIFEGCFLKEIGQLSFDYQNAEASPVTNNFTIEYQQIKFDFSPTK